MWGEDIPGKVLQDNFDDFIASVFHEIQMAQEEGRQIQPPEELTEKEAMRLGILISSATIAAAPVHSRAHAGMPVRGRRLQSGVAGLGAASSALMGPVGGSDHSTSTTGRTGICSAGSRLVMGDLRPRGPNLGAQRRRGVGYGFNRPWPFLYIFIYFRTM
jgi:hypothetical protein